MARFITGKGVSDVLKNEDLDNALTGYIVIDFYAGCLETLPRSL
jgi:hypothetical protein